jgi:quinol monooxygenase YgiN
LLRPHTNSFFLCAGQPAATFPAEACVAGAPDRLPCAGRAAREHWEKAAVIHVVAIITTKPGMREKVLEAFRANMPAVHAEEGCIEYVPTVDADGLGSFQAKCGPDTFVVVEKWSSVETLKAHAAAPHMAAYGAKVKDMIAGRVIHVLEPT